MEQKVQKILYENALGKTELKDVIIDMGQDQIDLYLDGVSIEDLDYGVNGRDIMQAESEIALQFFKENYQAILSGVYELNRDEILAVQNYLSLNKLQFAKIIGLDRGSLANIYKRNSCSHPVQILIIERMGMELSRKGSAKAMYHAMSKLPCHDVRLAEPDLEVSAEIANIRFGGNAA